MRKEIIALMVNEQWLSEQIRGWMLRKGKACVCVETIYSYIRFDRSCGGNSTRVVGTSSSHNVSENECKTKKETKLLNIKTTVLQSDYINSHLLLKSAVGIYTCRVSAGEHLLTFFA